MKHQLKSIVFGKGTTTNVERTSDVAAYLAMIANFKPLTIEEEIELAERIKKGDKAAKDTLVNHNLRAVVSIAKSYSYCGGCLTLLDLINEGNQGLIEAAELYDATIGTKFMSFAVSFVRKYILDALTHKSRLVADYHKDTPNQHSSLDAPTSDDADTTLGDILCTSVDAEVSISDSLSTDLLRVLNSILQPKEVTIICTIYGIGTTQMSRKTIAEKMNKTDERIRQIIEGAIVKVRKNDQAMTLLMKYI